MRAAIAAAAVALAGCVEGIAPGEVGVGRRVGIYPGELAAFLPPMTDRAGNLYVVTGQPDSTGSPQPGTAHTASARGGWSMGCPSGPATFGGARGWIGATNGLGWFWNRTEIIELDVGAAMCRPKLNMDPSSMSDLFYRAVAPIVDESVSGRFAVAIVSAGTDAMYYLTTVDLGLSVLRSNVPLLNTQVLATGADPETGEAAFAIIDSLGPRIILTRPHDGIVGEVPISGTVPGESEEIGEIVFGNDGSIVATIRTDNLAVGTRAGLTMTPSPLRARTLDRDDDGRIWVIGTDTADAPVIAPVDGGVLGAAQPWLTAMQLDDSLAAGVVVIDDRAGMRVASRWLARSAYGPSVLLPRRGAPHYAVGARAVLVADPPVDRGGIPFSQIAVVPVGVVFE